MKTRLLGLLCLLVAAAAAWWGIWQPLQLAAAQEQRVRYGLTVFVLVAAASVFGLFFAVFGDSVPYRDAARQRFTAAGWVLLLLIAAGSGAGFWWFKSRMEALGYGYSGASPAPRATLAPPYDPPPTVRQPDFTSGQISLQVRPEEIDDGPVGVS